MLNKRFETVAKEKIRALVEKATQLYRIPLFACEGSLGKLLHDFEHRIRRGVDVFKPNVVRNSFTVNLHEPSTPCGPFYQQELHITADEYRDIFEPCIQDACAVIEDQFDKAKLGNFKIDALIVSGEFSRSQPLQDAINGAIDLWQERSVDPTYTNDRTAAAVAIGAVFRALNKAHGPGCFLRTGFGILQHLQAPLGINDVPGPDTFAATDPQNARFSARNGIQLSRLANQYCYSKDVINWLLRKGMHLPAGSQFGPFDQMMTWTSTVEDWTLAYIFYTTI
jgi:hypothetical protein